MRRFLQGTFDAFRYLFHRLVHGCARPGGLDDHGLDDEGGIFVAPQPEIGQRTGDHRNDHHVDDQRAVFQRPIGKIKSAHGSDPSTRTF